MNLDQFETFLEIAETGNFNRASENLNVTQSTVSARIRGLEDTLGRSLFERSHAGVTLTAAGQQFRRYALNMMKLWQQARLEVKLPQGYRAMVGLGAQVSLWDRLVLRWMPWMRSNAPDVAIHVETDYSTSLSRQLMDGLLDIGVMYTPRQMSGFIIEPLLEEVLVLVSSEPNAPPPPDDPAYIFVDWGDIFRVNHAEHYPDMPPPAVSVGLGALGLQYLLQNGGSGYFPMRVVRSLIRDERLYRVENAPTLRRPGYVVYASNPRDKEVIEHALGGLRQIAAQQRED